MIRIFTDSSSDLSPLRCEQLNVEMLPITVIFGDEHYRSNIDITTAEFYEKLSVAQKLPTTVQITPTEFEEVFAPYIEQGDEIVGLFLSSDLSGTFQSANIAKGALKTDRIHLVDTRTVTFPLGLLVEEAVKMRSAGLSAAKIAENVAQLVPRLRLWAFVDDLKYLKMGGRLSPTSAVVANILNIRPIITIRNGMVDVEGRVRGRQAGYLKIEELIKNHPISSDYIIALGHNSEEAYDGFESHFSHMLKKRGHTVSEIGSVVGTHIGPGACGIAYIRK